MLRENFCEDWTVETAQLMEMMPAPDRRAVTLPHDMTIEQARVDNRKKGALSEKSMRNDSMRGCWPTGFYKYVKSFHVPSDWNGKTIYFEFEGVYRDGHVLINDDFAAHHPNGYTAFHVCANPYLRFGKLNTLSVLTRNGDDSRWYAGTGIYRPANLMIGGPVHITPEGIKWHTCEMDPFGAVVQAKMIVRNRGNVRTGITIRSTIRDVSGGIVAEDCSYANVFPGKDDCIRQRLTVPKPQLWSAESPYLYSCETVLEDTLGNEIDRCEERFGIRTMALDARSGLRINGIPTKLRGGAVHADAGPLGMAAFSDTESRRVRILKEAGFNTIWIGHHAAGRALMNACDEQGMYIMTEFSDEWGRGKVPEGYANSFEKYWEEDITSIVDDAYNHPSVIIYSIGNEICEAGSPAGSGWGRILAGKFKALDPYRYTANSINGLVGLGCVQDGVPKEQPQEVSATGEATKEQDSAHSGDINDAMNDLVLQMDQIMKMPIVGISTQESYACVDIGGYNYMDARYEMDHALYPNRVILGSETYSPEIDRLWRKVTALPYVIGDISWTAWDYLGENGIGKVIYEETPTVYMDYPWQCSYSGDISIIGERRPISYYREIVYGLRKDPYIAVQRPEHYGQTPIRTPWSWTDSVSGWTWEGFEGKPIVVEVYADADEVALFVNGKEVGRRTCKEDDRFKAEFDTIYEPGVIEAVSYRNGEETGRFAVHTAEGSCLIQALPEKKEAEMGTDTLFYIDVSLTDAQGRLFHNREEKISISVDGPGLVKGYGSGSPVTEEHFFDSVRTTFNGRLLAVVRPMGVGRIHVTFTGEDGQKAETTLVVK